MAPMVNETGVQIAALDLEAMEAQIAQLSEEVAQLRHTEYEQQAQSLSFQAPQQIAQPATAGTTTAPSDWGLRPDIRTNVRPTSTPAAQAFSPSLLCARRQRRRGGPTDRPTRVAGLRKEHTHTTPHTDALTSRGQGTKRAPEGSVWGGDIREGKTSSLELDAIYKRFLPKHLVLPCDTMLHLTRVSELQKQLAHKKALYFPIFLRHHWIAGILHNRPSGQTELEIFDSAPSHLVHRDLERILHSVWPSLVLHGTRHARARNGIAKTAGCL